MHVGETRAVAAKFRCPHLAKFKKILRSTYADFVPTLATEKLRTKHGHAGERRARCAGWSAVRRYIQPRNILIVKMANLPDRKDGQRRVDHGGQSGHFYLAESGHFYLGITCRLRIMYIMLNYNYGSGCGT